MCFSTLPSLSSCKSLVPLRPLYLIPYASSTARGFQSCAAPLRPSIKLRLLIIALPQLRAMVATSVVYRRVRMRSLRVGDDFDSICAAHLELLRKTCTFSWTEIQAEGPRIQTRRQYHRSLHRRRRRQLREKLLRYPLRLRLQYHRLPLRLLL